MIFDGFDDSIHEHPEQKKRFESALSGKLVPISVDFERQTGVFNGSGKVPYNTTLAVCTCADFLRRKLPCKHMYRLAIELNLIKTDDVAVQRRSYGSDERTLKDKAKNYIDTLDEKDAITLARYCYELHYKGCIIVKKQDIPDVITSSNIFEDSKDIVGKLTYLKKSDLIELLSDTDLKVKSLKKSDLVILVIKNPTYKSCDYLETVVSLAAKDEYKPLLLSLHKYAHKLHPQEHNYCWT